MEKRVFIAVLLSFLILAGYQAYFAPPPANPTAPAPAVSVPPSPSNTAATTGSVPSLNPAGTPAPAKAATAVVGDEHARDIVVDTDDVVAVFSTEGAVLTSWKLKHYLASPDSKGASGLLDLVPSDVPGDKPFTLRTDDAATSAILAQALYRPSVDHLLLGSSSGTLTVYSAVVARTAVSIQIVTGPSLREMTFMSAAKRPVSTRSPVARASRTSAS